MLIKTFSAVALTTILSGCASFDRVATVSELGANTQTTLTADSAQFRARVADSYRSQGSHVQRPWIAGAAVPLAREVTLPAPLRANVNTTMLFADSAGDLLTVAERIQRATGIPVQVTPDALLPRDRFLPRLAGEAKSDAGAAQLADVHFPGLRYDLPTDRQAGPLIPALGRDNSRISSAPALLPDGQAPLANVLDMVSLRMGTYWRYEAELGAIVIYRTETRQFNVRALALAAQTELELGLASQGGGDADSGGGAFESRSRSRFTSDSSDTPTLAAVVTKIGQFLTRAGSVVAPEGASNIIVVTDTRESLDQVARYLEAENRALTRRVRLVIDEITLTRDDVDKAGIDWNLVFTSGGRATGATGIGAGTMVAAADSAASLGASIGAGQWSGSSVSIQALSQLGTVVRRTSMPVLTLNRRPVTYAVRDSFEYVRSLQQTQSTSDSTGPTVTATQQKETVGTFVTLVPDAQDDGQVLLTLAYDDTRLIELQRQELGTDGSFVQQPRITGRGVTQQVELRPGQPIIVAGFSQESDSARHRRADRGAPMLLGGGNEAQSQHTYTLVIVTALPEEGM